MEDKKKGIALSLLIVLLVLSIVFVSYEFIVELKSNDIIETENKVYGTVAEVGKNYIILESTEDEKYVVNTKEDTDEGDFVVVYYDKLDDIINANDVDVIAKNSEMQTINVKKEDKVADLVEEDTTNNQSTTTTTKKVTVQNNTTTKKQTTIKSNATTTKQSVVQNTTTKKVATTTYNTTVNSSKNEEVLFYVTEQYNEVNNEDKSSNWKEKSKQTFINLVDFIFYGGTIKGVTWNELNNKTKAKVVYYTLLIDSKIDSKWPNYKDSISNKYNDIKSKLIAKYFEISTEICEKKDDNCAQVKSDFTLLKKSLNLTWSVIKSAFSYAYQKGASALSKWYEVFSGK